MNVSSQMAQVDDLVDKYGEILVEVIHVYLNDENSLSNFFQEFPKKQEAATACSKWYEETLKVMQESLNDELDKISNEIPVNRQAFKSIKEDSEYYLYDIHPFVLQYLLWLYLNDKDFSIEHADSLHTAAIFGTLGYRLLDLDIDEGKQSNNEMRLLSAFLIQKYEDGLLNCFGYSKENCTQLSIIKYAFIQEELRQQQLRFKSSCYKINDLKQMADKAIHLFAPFALGLIRFEKKNLYNEYWNIFRCTFAPIQLIDDIQDMEEDIASGHYSIFWKSGNGEMVNAKSISEKTLSELYIQGIGSFNEARESCKQIQDYIFLLNIEKTRLRFNSTFLDL